MSDLENDDPTSPEVQAIFAQLHALGVTPEQAAAGVRLLASPFRVGDRVSYYMDIHVCLDSDIAVCAASKRRAPQLVS